MRKKIIVSRRRFLLSSCSVIIILSILTACLCSCSSSEENDYSKYLGNINYSSDIYAMQIEAIDEEDVPGVVYREVTDLEGLIQNAKIPICLYFFSSTAVDNHGISAGVEDISERLNGRVLLVGIDILLHRDLVTKYGILAVPDFILLRQGSVVNGFEASTYDYWNTMDVYNWLILNKI